MADATGVRIALLGCGGWGMNHVRTWSELGNLALVCDPDAARLEFVRDRYPNLPVTQDATAVFEANDVDAVVVATPAPTHVDLAMRAIEAGKPVLVEKPLATRLEDGERLVAAADKSGVPVMVGHVLEYHPAFVRLRELVQEGTFGKIVYVYSHRLNFGRVRTEENALWSFAPHDIALLIRLLGSTPQVVACHGVSYLSGDVADVTTTNLDFRGGVQAHLFVSWLHPFKEHRFVVVGERQMAVFDDTAPWSDKLVVYGHAVEWVDGRVPVARKADKERVAVEQGEPLRLECLHFLDCVTGSKRPLTDAASGLEVLRVLDAGERSLRTQGAPVSLAGTAPQGFFAHPTATIDPGAMIGDGVKVWHGSHVMPGAAVGSGCILGQNVFVGADVKIGPNTKIQNNVSVYTGVEIEQDVFCGPSMVFTNVINPRSAIERKSEFRRTLIQQGATLGANCTIVCGTTVGRYAFVAAGAVVTHDVPDHGLVMGVPARLTGFVCVCGERLDIAEAALTECHLCGRSYRLIEPSRLVALGD